MASEVNVSAIYRHICERLRADRDFEWRGSLDSLNPAQRVLFTIMEFDGQINNGGFDQYFYNSTANWWPETLDSLEKIGAKDHHLVLDMAVALFGDDGPSTDQDRRCRQITAPIVTMFSDNDSFYYRLPSPDALLEEFARENLEALWS